MGITMYKSIFFSGLLVISSLQASEATSYDEWLETKRSPLDNASSRLFKYSSTDVDDPATMFAGIDFNAIDVNKPASNGFLLLGSASHYGKLKTVEFLLDKKAAIDAEDTDRYTALMHAANHGHASVVTLLLNRNADPEKTDRYCFTALTMACRKRNKDAIDQLLLHKANTEVTHWFGGTPLTLVADQEPYAEKHAIIKFLLVAKANPKHKDSMEKNAQDRAKEIGDHATAALLAKYEQKYIEQESKKSAVGPMRETDASKRKEQKQSAKKLIDKN